MLRICPILGSAHTSYKLEILPFPSVLLVLMKLPHSANKQNHTLKQAQELQYTILMKHGKTSI
jgi:hypothetical protein